MKFLDATLYALARRVGIAAGHDLMAGAAEDDALHCDSDCLGCRAESAALAALRELRELAALEADLFYARTVPFNAAFDMREIWQADTAQRIAKLIRALGEPPREGAPDVR